MGRIVRFTASGGQGTYVFPSTQQNLNENFKNFLNRVTRLPNSDGGMDEFGSGYAPSAVGSISFSFVLVSPTLEGMEVKRREVGAMGSWGTGALFYQPTDPALPTVWANVRMNNIDAAQKLSEHTDRFQPVTLTMQAASPFWYGRGSELLWDDPDSAATWDGSDVWDGNSSAPAPTSVTDSGTVTISSVGGNVHTLARLMVIKDSAGTLSNPMIERIVNGSVVDRIRWFGDLANGDILEINSRQSFVRKNGSNAYSTFDLPLNADWMWLRPGSNTLRVTWTGTGKLAVRWLERYK